MLILWITKKQEKHSGKIFMEKEINELMVIIQSYRDNAIVSALPRQISWSIYAVPQR